MGLGGNRTENTNSAVSPSLGAGETATWKAMSTLSPIGVGVEVEGATVGVSTGVGVGLVSAGLADSLGVGLASIKVPAVGLE